MLVFMDTPLFDLEARLQARYQTLVEQHSAPAHPLAAGLRALPDGGSAFAATQAAWRFFKNPKVTLPVLCQPLQDHVGFCVATQALDYVLIAHDWSWLDYQGHTTKRDRKANPNQGLGYDLLSALAISSQTGAPLAPISLALESGEGVYTSWEPALKPAFLGHQEALWAHVQQVEALALPARCVHIVDREADSVQQFRAFVEADHRCLIRGKENQYVEVEGREVQLRHLASRLCFSAPRAVLYHGQAAQQGVAETTVRLTRPYIKVRNKAREVIPGAPVCLRLIVSEVRSEAGTLLSRWYLYTNVEESVPAAQIALWYYWRWQIECFYKLLKSAGWHLEDWQQESASALVKRLAVVSMAAALVWAIQHCRDPQIEPLRRELVRLSGRQMKRGQPVTAPALLAGLGTLLCMMELLERYTPDELQILAQQARYIVRRP
jgi:hypothetical protein